MSETAAILGPDGQPLRSTPAAQGALLDNRTGLPDEVVQDAVLTYVNEQAAFVGGGRIDSFQNYSGAGSLLAKEKWEPPANVIEEIELAREVARTDDDVSSAIDLMVALAFEGGMQNNHPDEKTVTLFNRAAEFTDLDATFAEMYREWLITGQVTTICAYERSQLVYTPEGGDGRSRQVISTALPRVGIMPAENVRPLGSDMFGNVDLAYDPRDNNASLKDWLEEWFAEDTAPARRNEMRKLDPVSAQLFIERIEVTSDEQTFIGSTAVVYRMNPKMVARSTMAKGAAQHASPLVTRDLALVEAKRLLNLLDYSLLQGGIGMIVVAKKGSESLPAQPQEVQNLNDVLSRASRTGVIVGDHRLNIEIITPKLDQMLSKDRRTLIGRKLVMGMLRVPEATTEQPGVAGMEAQQEFMARVVQHDRHRLKRHMENKIYAEIESRNKGVFTLGYPSIWFPKIVLQGTQYFTDFVLKLRDRGDIPRKWAVEAAGYDYEAALSQRSREVDRGDDDILAPASVPFSNGAGQNPDANPDPPAAPNDNGPGRPPGARTDTGERVVAMYDDVEDKGFRAGETTYSILEEYAGKTEIGRISKHDRAALAEEAAGTYRNVHLIPVNPGYEVNRLKAVRLGNGATLFVGRRKVDNAIVAKAVSFRDMDFSLEEAVAMVSRWGFPIDNDEVAVPES